MSPIADAAESRIMSHRRAGVVRSSSRLGQSVPETFERRAVPIAMAAAKTFVQICEAGRALVSSLTCLRKEATYHLVKNRRLGSEGVG